MQGEGELIRVQHGDRSIMVRRAASDATWQQAEGFLLGKRSRGVGHVLVRGGNRVFHVN